MKFAILTTFQDFNPGYSLTGIVIDQIKMLTRQGHEVDLYVSEHYNGTEVDGANIKPFIPFAHLKDYKSKKDLTADHADVVSRMKDLLLQEGPCYDFIWTHDLVFTGWNMPYALGIQEAAAHEDVLKDVRWLHWIHSVPSLFSDWWEYRAYGSKHRLVFPNKTDALRVAENYRGELSCVEVIPHIKDIRSWGDYSKEAWDFIDDYPLALHADVVQVFPASVDRLKAKKVDDVILIFSKMKKRGQSVCLIIANQWATGTQQKQDVEHFLKIARRNGLVPGEEVIFTSTWRSPQYDTGIPKRLLRELMQLSNLFIFPTQEESFGLVVPEVSLSSGALMVLNKSLEMQMEISGWTTLYFDFGSYRRQHNVDNEENYFQGIADVIRYRMQRNESLLHRTFCRKAYNMDRLYFEVYLPILRGAVTW